MSFLDSIKKYFTSPPATGNAQPFRDVDRDWRSMHTKIVGVTFRNDDGTLRQSNLAKVTEGDTLKILPYRYNGEPALGVYTVYDKMIGNISKEIAADLDNEGHVHYYAMVEDTTGGGDKNIGCNITLYFSK